MILFSNNLYGTISTQIENLDKLNELQLQRNEFSGTVPDGGLLALNELGKLSAHFGPFRVVSYSIQIFSISNSDSYTL